MKNGRPVEMDTYHSKCISTICSVLHEWNLGGQLRLEQKLSIQLGKKEPYCLLAQAPGPCVNSFNQVYIISAV